MPDAELDVASLVSGDRRTLARAITLVESRREDHEAEARALLDSVMHLTGTSLRLGITGVPGVGKSTFIESLGLEAVKAGRRVAVLAVDPSSPVSGGSILGDKTRMEHLTRSADAFIRPSPAADALGGVAHKTRESMLLCEAAGYDFIVVETVGVGQSEYEVSHMVDFFLVLMLPNAGDELQGIKKGILELADAIVINKADGDNIRQAERARATYQSALRLFQHAEPTPQVLSCSAVTGDGIDAVHRLLAGFYQGAKESGTLTEKRAQQNRRWLKKLTAELLERRIKEDPETRRVCQELEQRVIEGLITPYTAAAEIGRRLAAK